jgi:predicted methyltransferase
LEMDGLGVKDADIVFTFRNYHNFGPEGRAAMNHAVFAALKPGGIYAVVDHNRRHMEPDNAENRRRIDPVLAIREIQAAGFELVDFSDLHYRPDDELRYEVGRKTVTGNTDRWTRVGHRMIPLI